MKASLINWKSFYGYIAILHTIKTMNSERNGARVRVNLPISKLAGFTRWPQGFSSQPNTFA